MWIPPFCQYRDHAVYHPSGEDHTCAFPGLWLHLISPAPLKQVLELQYLLVPIQYWPTHFYKNKQSLAQKYFHTPVFSAFREDIIEILLSELHKLLLKKKLQSEMKQEVHLTGSSEHTYMNILSHSSWYAWSFTIICKKKKPDQSSNPFLILYKTRH